jgi:hypothetical protein
LEDLQLLDDKSPLGCAAPAPTMTRNRMKLQPRVIDISPIAERPARFTLELSFRKHSKGSTVDENG